MPVNNLDNHIRTNFILFFSVTFCSHSVIHLIHYSFYDFIRECEHVVIVIDDGCNEYIDFILFFSYFRSYICFVFFFFISVHLSYIFRQCTSVYSRTPPMGLQIVIKYDKESVLSGKLSLYVYRGQTD